jgi:hypothetical protein
MDAYRRIWSVLAARVRLRKRGTTAREPLRDQTDAELYRVWSASTAELRKALNPEQTGSATQGRRYLLVEIERCHPRETAHWLSFAAILSDEPPKFLIRDG